MPTGSIPASNYVSVTPGVILAGGGALDLIGLGLTASPRVPIGAVYSFASPLAVAQFFGTSSNEANFANVYFLGFDNSNTKPGALLFSQYPTSAVAAYLRGGQISGLSLAQLGAISGSLTVVMDGYTHTASSINLTGTTSFSNAASIIQTALDATEPTEATVTASVGATFTGSQSGTNLTTTSVVGIISVGDTITGTGVAANTTIVSQTSGPVGGAGVYVTSVSGTASSAACVGASNVMNVTAVGSGVLAIGQTLTAVSGFTAALLTALGTGTGSTGTYVFAGAQQSYASGSITAKATAPTVTYDSIAGAFVVTSGITGTQSTVAFATGSAAAPLLLTQAAGAVLSQGAAIATPASAMNAVVALTTNWASFTTVGFQPITADKLAFAAWNNSQGNEYVYAGWDTDITVTTSNDSSSFGFSVIQAGYSGTALLYEPTNIYIAAFLMGAMASIDFDERNGSIDFSYKPQSGLTPGVVNQTIANQLEANGYNYYAAVATKKQGFNFFYPGFVSGPYGTLRPYVEQIWLNNAFQLALMNLLKVVKKVPYNPQGYGLIRAACLDPITAAINFGAIEPNTPLSTAQAAEVNLAAGVQIDNTLSTIGWYLQILPASPQTRSQGGTPPITFWYTDGGAVRRLNIASIDVQ